MNWTVLLTGYISDPKP